MLEHSLVLKLSSPSLAGNTTSRLRQEYQAYQRLFQVQSEPGKQYLSSQAAALAGAIMNGMLPVHFSLPEQVVCLPMMDCPGMDEKTPPQARQQRIGSFLDRFTHPDLTEALGRRLMELEKSTSQAVSVSAGLIRHTVAMALVYHLLPAGKAVVYATPQDDDIPNQPVIDYHAVEPFRPAPIGKQAGDKDLLDGSLGSDPHRSYADKFFLPQYVAFDDQNQLLAGDLQEAIADIQAMRRYLLALNSAVCLAPYMVVDEEFQSRRYGVLGQLINQGRALTNYQVGLLCQTIRTRSTLHELDRGLSLSLPYFNDETLRIETYKFDIIPTGWVMFVPAFVVLAARAEATKVLQNTRLSLSTRKALVQELCILERAFLR